MTYHNCIASIYVCNIEMRPIRLKYIKIICICICVLAVILFFSNYGLQCGSKNDLTVNDGHELKLHKKYLQEFQDELQRYRSNRVNSDSRSLPKRGSSPPWIYAITPTHTRPQQKAELTRLSQTLLHLQNFHWIVVEDSPQKTDLVANFLARSKLNYTHLYVKTPSQSKLKPGDPHWSKFRGVLQRNIGLRWLRINEIRIFKPSVLYFMDDDNTYDLELFREMRSTQRVSIWPVGIVAKLRYERPICDKGKVTGWFTFWQPQRPFVSDMAGFAVNTQVILRFYQAEFSFTSKVGYLESDFLSLVTSMDELEPLFNCTKVYVWHTRTMNPDLSDEAKMKKKYGYRSDANVEI